MSDEDGAMSSVELSDEEIEVLLWYVDPEEVRYAAEAEVIRGFIEKLEEIKNEN